MKASTENNRLVELEDIPGFEGPEKKLELDFLISCNVPEGLRKISEEEWKVLLSEINCSILSKLSNQHCDAYILSESSLFVFSSKIIIKTCGQITLLNCIPLLIQYGNKVEAKEIRVSFSRRNLIFPENQFSPHTSFEEEVTFLKQYFPGGNSFVFGPKDCDRHYMFVYQNENAELPPKPPHSLEVLMTGLDRCVMKQFCRDEKFISVQELTHRSNIQSVFKSTTLVDAHAFEPLGFSLNSLDGDCYTTIHVTPQPECSYVSFETTDVNFEDADKLVSKVIGIFKPETFCVLIICDDVSFVTEAFPNFKTRGFAHHDFNGTGNVLTWYSYQKTANSTTVEFQEKLCSVFNQVSSSSEFTQSILIEERRQSSNNNDVDLFVH
jgi:S-adenosylmethionine decarboxylase